MKAIIALLYQIKSKLCKNGGNTDDSTPFLTTTRLYPPSSYDPV